MGVDREQAMILLSQHALAHKHGNVPRVYFAGKVSKTCYRTTLLKNSRVMSGIDTVYDTAKGRIQYNGPYSLSCDHGCYHSYPHGRVSCYDPIGPGQICGNEDTGCFTPRQATCECRTNISDSNFIVAYIETLDCFGTIAEIGFSSALKKAVFLFIKDELWSDLSDRASHDNECHDDLWFVKHLPFVVAIPGFPDLSVIPNDFFPKQTYKEKYHEYLRSEKWSSLRKLKIKESDGRCQVCNSVKALQVHHRSYDNIFNEEVADLIVLCKTCHGTFHKVSE